MELTAERIMSTPHVELMREIEAGIINKTRQDVAPEIEKLTREMNEKTDIVLVNYRKDIEHLFSQEPLPPLPRRLSLSTLLDFLRRRFK